MENRCLKGHKGWSGRVPPNFPSLSNYITAFFEWKSNFSKLFQIENNFVKYDRGVYFLFWELVGIFNHAAGLLYFLF